MDIYLRLTYSLLTLYMMLILLRWCGPVIGLDVQKGRWRFVSLLTDPLIKRIRAMLPNMGPFDFAPIAALFIVFFIRVLSVRILADFAAQSSL